MGATSAGRGGNVTELREVQQRIHEAQSEAYRHDWGAQQSLVYVLEVVNGLLYRPEKRVNDDNRIANT